LGEEDSGQYVYENAECKVVTPSTTSTTTTTTTTTKGTTPGVTVTTLKTPPTIITPKNSACVI